MVTVSKHHIPFLLQCVLFLIPVNIYVIGDWLAAGVQWILFRYQQSSLGNSLIIFYRDLYYLQEGILKGNSIAAAVLALIAACILILAVLFQILALDREYGVWERRAAVITLTGGLLYLISDIIQYGIFLHGPSGFVIPVGIPVILLAGVWMYRMDLPDRDEQQDPEQGEGEDSP